MSAPEGIYLPICTPFGHDECLDEAALVSNMRFYAACPAAGFLVLGSNAENKSLTPAEQARIVQLVQAHKRPDQALVLAVLYESERLVLEFVDTVDTANIDYIALQSPAYFRKRMTDDVLYGFFSRLADALPVPIMLYNAPGFTGVNLSTELVTTLHTHGNIAGIKDSGAGDIERFFPLINEDFSVFAGSMNFLFKALKGNGTGGVVSLGNAFPKIACEVFDLFKQGQIEAAESLQCRLVSANKAVSGTHGVAGVKAAMDLAGLKGGPPRRPLVGLGNEQIAVMKANLVTQGMMS